VIPDIEGNMPQMQIADVNAVHAQVAGLAVAPERLASALERRAAQLGAALAQAEQALGGLETALS
jgi:hypothetical protein